MNTFDQFGEAGREGEPLDAASDSRKPVPKFGTPPRYSVEIVPVSCTDAEARRGVARAFLARLLARETMKRRKGEVRRKAA